jgi:hypothetical protein
MLNDDEITTTGKRSALQREDFENPRYIRKATIQYSRVQNLSMHKKENGINVANVFDPSRMAEQNIMLSSQSQYVS